MEKLSIQKTQDWLIWFYKGILFLFFLTLLARLVDLQIIKGEYYKVLAEGNRIKRVNIVAPRGRILARGGEVLVGNKEVKKKIFINSNKEVEKVEVEENFEGSDVITEWERYYPLSQGFAHVSGYLGETNSDEVGKVRGECPEKGPRKLGEIVGRSGLEEVYDCLLSGIDGEELIEVDALGEKVRTLGRKPAVPGKDLKTTIDYNLQEKISKLMEGKRGSIIISDSKGEILALYSSPSFNPEFFIKKSKKNEVLAYLDDKSLPLLNRGIGGRYHPGSIFKLVVAIAGLEEGKIDKNYVFEDTGSIVVKTAYGEFRYSNWYFTQYGRVEGKIGLTKAIARSTDTFFYKLGEMLGPQSIADWSHKFWLDEKTGIDLTGEISGLIPSPSWKLEVKGERWFLGNTYHISIGQGDVSLTPIEVNTLIQAIANASEICTPHIIEKEERCSNLNIEKKNLNLVIDGMKQACSRGGTGFTFFDFMEKTGIDVACKTGTAETEGGDPHAWFVAFAPVENPEIVATVLVENGGEGSSASGPIAREIFDYWFKERDGK